MKLTKAQYDEMLRERPHLKPSDPICPNIGRILAKHYLESLSQKSFLEVADEVMSADPYKLPIVTQNLLKSPRTLKFTVSGQPVGKPRQTQSDRWKKRPCVMRYRAWADKARASVPKGVELAVYREVHFKAYLEIPKSYSKSKRALLTGGPHLSRGDCDNFLKAIQDSLFKQDCVIWKFSGEKRWDDGAGARIEVELR